MAAGVLSIGPCCGLAHAQQTPSAADLAQVRPLLNQGFTLREQGDLAGALERFKAAHALAETPVTGVELGRAYMALGKLVEARETFLSVARTIDGAAFPGTPTDAAYLSATRFASSGNWVVSFTDGTICDTCGADTLPLRVRCVH